MNRAGNTSAIHSQYHHGKNALHDETRFDRKDIVRSGSSPSYLMLNRGTHFSKSQHHRSIDRSSQSERIKIVQRKEGNASFESLTCRLDAPMSSNSSSSEKILHICPARDGRVTFLATHMAAEAFHHNTLLDPSKRMLEGHHSPKEIQTRFPQ